MIYFFAGENTFDLKGATKSMVNTFVAAHGDLSLERIDAEESSISQIMDAVSSMPFLVSNKMVLVTNVSAKELIEQLLEADIPDTTDVIVQITKLDKRASYYKKLTKHSGYKIFDTAPTYNLSSWVVDVTEDAGGTISSTDAKYLIDRVGTNKMMLSNEINKLISYDTRITKETINLLCDPLPQTTVFQLLDAAFAGKKSEVANIYKEQRAQKVEPQAIVGLIAWQLHVIALIKVAGNKSPDSIAKDAKINPYVVKKSVSLARKLTFIRIKELLAAALELDSLLKTKPVDADQALQNYLLKIAIS